MTLTEAAIVTPLAEIATVPAIKSSIVSSPFIAISIGALSPRAAISALSEPLIVASPVEAITIVTPAPETSPVATAEGPLASWPVEAVAFSSLPTESASTTSIEAAAIASTLEAIPLPSLSKASSIASVESPTVSSVEPATLSPFKSSTIPFAIEPVSCTATIRLPSVTTSREAAIVPAFESPISRMALEWPVVTSSVWTFLAGVPAVVASIIKCPFSRLLCMRIPLESFLLLTQRRGDSIANDLAIIVVTLWSYEDHDLTAKADGGKTLQQLTKGGPDYPFGRSRSIHDYGACTSRHDVCKNCQERA